MGCYEAKTGKQAFQAAFGLADNIKGSLKT